MTMKDIYILTVEEQKIMLRDAATFKPLFSGKPDDFPIKYADWTVFQLNAIGNILTIDIYN